MIYLSVSSLWECTCTTSVVFCFVFFWRSFTRSFYHLRENFYIQIENFYNHESDTIRFIYLQVIVVYRLITSGLPYIHDFNLRTSTTEINDFTDNNLIKLLKFLEITGGTELSNLP